MADYIDPRGDGSFANWPYCAVEGCPNKCCLALDSIYCFPHTPGNKHVKHMKIDAASVDPLAVIASDLDDEITEALADEE